MSDHAPAPLAGRPLARVEARLADILDFGMTPYGHRRIVDILGGTVTGRITGTILPGGADWQIRLNDSLLEIHARYTIRSAGGGHVLVDSRGLRHGPPEVLARLARGEPVDWTEYYFRTAMRFEAAGPDVEFLNHVLAVARGRREANGVVLDVFEVL